MKHVSPLTQAGWEQGSRAQFNILPLLTVMGQTPKSEVLLQAKCYVLSVFSFIKAA